MTGTLLGLFRHKTWATLRLIEYSPGLADEHLDATIPGTFGTIHETLRRGLRRGGGLDGAGGLPQLRSAVLLTQHAQM